MVEFLTKVFGRFDDSLFRAVHSLASDAGGFFTPLCKVITFIGEKGLIFFVAAVVLMLFAKTRKFGVCMFGAVACGAIITNLILKDTVARPRPFENMVYRQFWFFVGHPAEDGYSFPSGHITAIMAAMTAMFIFCNKKWSWVGFLGVLLMGFSRVYLIAHYPSDVLAGIVVGAVACVIAFFITKLIFKLLNKYSDKKFCNFVLTFDVANLFKKQKTNEEEPLIEEATKSEGDE